MNPTPRPRPWRRVAVLAAMVAGAALAVGLLGRRELPLDALRRRGLPATEAELAAMEPPIPDDRNLALCIHAARMACKVPLGCKLPYFAPVQVDPSILPRPDDPDPASLAAWRALLADNAVLLGHMDRALSLSESQGRPADPKDPEPDMAAWTWRHAPGTVAKVLQLAALVHAHDGDAAACGRDIEAMLKVARAWQGPVPDPTVNGFERDAVLNAACTAARHHLGRVPFDEAALRRMQAAFEAADTNVAWIRVAAEAVMIARICTEPTDKTAGPGDTPSARAQGLVRAAMWNWAGGRRDMLETEAAFLGDVREAMRAPLPGAFDLVSAAGTNAAAKPTRARLTGPPRFVMRAGRYRWLLEQDAIALAHVRATRVAIAAERHRLAHGGAEPGSIAALVPAYLDVVPADPFDGAPLRHARMLGGHSTWSIGPDRVDNAGNLGTNHLGAAGTDIEVQVTTGP